MIEALDRNRMQILGAAGLLALSLLLAAIGLRDLGRVDPAFLGHLPQRVIELAFVQLPLRLADEIPWTLAIARWALPGSFALAGLVLLHALTRRPRESFVAARQRDHIVVCGPGEGVTAAVRNLRDAGETVVLLQPNPAGSDSLEVSGDPALPRDLSRAGAGRARALVALADTDEENVRVVQAARDLMSWNPERKNPLRLVARLSGEESAGVADLLKRDRDRARIVPVVFSPVRTMVRELFDVHPVDRHFDVESGKPLNVIILGFDAVTRHVLLEVLQTGHVNEAGIRVAVLDPKAVEAEKALRDRCPEIGEIASLVFRDFAFEQPRTALENLPAECFEAPLAAAYVSAPGLEATAVAVTALHRHLRKRDLSVPPVYVYAPGFEAAIEAMGTTEAPVVAMGSSDRVYSVENLLSESHDEMARAIHEGYLEDNPQYRGSAGGQPWELLEETYRDSNRRQARFYATALRVIGCSIVSKAQVEPFSFRDGEVERLARLEHRRWMADRRLDGWSYAPKRNNERRQHHLLVPFDQLPKEEQDKDRNAIRRIPERYGRIGATIVRTDRSRKGA